MAVEYVDLVLRGAFGLNPTAKLIMVILAEFSRRESNAIAWPSVPTIARLAGVSERWTQACLSSLVAAEWLTIIGDSRGGSGNSVHYQINVQRLNEAKKGSVKGELEITIPGEKKGEAEITLSNSERVKSVQAKGEVCAKKGEVQTPKRVNPSSPEPDLALLQPVLSRAPEGRSNPIDKGQGKPTTTAAQQGSNRPKTELQLRAEQIGEREVGRMKGRADHAPLSLEAMPTGSPATASEP